MSAGVVVWITGLPSAGKSKLGRAVVAALSRAGAAVCTLDGDQVRTALGSKVGYSTDERAAFYEILARLAALLASQGLVVVVPATAAKRRFREAARAMTPAFVEVWVDTPLDECARRDSKGLYAAQARGDARDVPGVDAEYEAPTSPDVIAHGGADRDACIAVAERVERLRAST